MKYDIPKRSLYCNSGTFYCILFTNIDYIFCLWY